MNQKLVMKLSVIALSIMTLGTAQELAYSGLDGVANGSIQGANDGTGWDTPWDTQNATDFYSVDDSSPLSYGSLQTSSGGEHISGGNNFTSLGRRLDLSNGGVFQSAGYVSNTSGTNIEIDQGGVLWFSTLIRRDGNAGRLTLGFRDNTNTPWTPPDTGNLLIQTTSGGAWFLGDGSTTSSTGKSPVNGTADFLALRFDMNGTNSSAHLWVNPATTSLGGPDLALGTADASLLGLDVADIKFRNIHMRLGSGTGEGSVDEIRFGETYASVSPIPEPSSFILVGLALIGFIAMRSRKNR
jgi:hypothetical protein